MTDLIAIGYDRSDVAASAAHEARRLAEAGVFAPVAIAAVARTPGGRYLSGDGRGVRNRASWNTARGLLALAGLAYRPVAAIAVAGLVEAVLGRRTGVDPAFEQDVRDMLAPGTSALFLAVDRIAPDEAVQPLSRFGGAVLRSSLSREAEHELDDALRRTPDRP